MTNQSLIGASQAAELAGVSVDTIKRAARLGLLEYTAKLPGSTGAYLFERSTVLAYAKGRAA